MYHIGMKNNEKNVSSIFKFVSPQHLCYIKKHFSNACTHKKETFFIFRLEIKILYGKSDFYPTGTKAFARTRA